MDDRAVYLVYTNHRGERSERLVVPQRLFFGVCLPWHQETQWLLEALDCRKGELRTFAMNRVEKWEAGHA